MGKKYLFVTIPNYGIEQEFDTLTLAIQYVQNFGYRDGEYRIVEKDTRIKEFQTSGENKIGTKQ